MERYQMSKKGNPKNKSFNDKMVGRTVIPAIYLWLMACAAVVGMGIWKPEVVLLNLDGFIALIAIIGGVAAPALQTVLRMWESEQSVEIENMGVELEHERLRDSNQHEHIMHLEKQAQIHEQEMDKITTDKGKSKGGK
ncbi:MAG: hypothetical protein CMC15_14940 [Flavobacteriaceae bacterium]|nr:hypothetical protein [Flavobacteriaceae bacterium]